MSDGEQNLQNHSQGGVPNGVFTRNRARANNVSISEIMSLYNTNQNPRAPNNNLQPKLSDYDDSEPEPTPQQKKTKAGKPGTNQIKELKGEIARMGEAFSNLEALVKTLVDMQKNNNPQNEGPNPEVHSSKDSSSGESSNTNGSSHIEALTTILSSNSTITTILNSCTPFTNDAKINPNRFIKQFHEATYGTSLSEIEKIKIFKRLVQVPNIYWDSHLDIGFHRLSDYESAFLEAFFSNEVQEGLRRQFEAAKPTSYEVVKLTEFFDMWHDCLTNLTYHRMTTDEVVAKLIDKLPYFKQDILRVQYYRSFSEFKRCAFKILKESDYKSTSQSKKDNTISKPPPQQNYTKQAQSFYNQNYNNRNAGPSSNQNQQNKGPVQQPHVNQVQFVPITSNNQYTVPPPMGQPIYPYPNNGNKTLFNGYQNTQNFGVNNMANSNSGN